MNWWVAPRPVSGGIGGSPGGRDHFAIEGIVFHAFSAELCRRHTLATARRTHFGRSEPMSRASRVVPSTIVR